MNRKVFIIAFAAFLCAALFPLPRAAQAAAQKMRVVYGFDREFPPFSFEDPGGEAVGFEVEILRAIFKDSVHFVPRPVQWDIIPTELAAGTITITSGMVKTEERAKYFRFAAMPTIRMQIQIFTKTHTRYPNLTFLRGQRVSVEQGAYQHRVLQTFGGINIKTYNDKTAPIKALYNDEVDAYCGPVQNAYYYMNKLGYGGISAMGTPLDITELRYAVNRDRGDILRMVDQGMKEIVENGEYDRIYRKWFVRELSADEGQKLLGAAKEATLTAYTPYTRQTRGAAVLTATGQIYRGSAVENRDSALSFSALTAALAQAIGAGDLELRAAVCVDAEGRTVPLTLAELTQLNEFGRGVLVMTVNAEGLLNGGMVGELIPGMRAAAQPQGR